MGSEFKVLIRVRFAECDAQNVVFNARYGDYVDIAISEYYREVFGGYETLLKQGLDSQVVRLATDWKSSAKYDDVLSAAVAVKHIGTSSFSFLVTFSEYFSGRDIATSEIVYVMVSAVGHQKMNLTDSFKAALMRDLHSKAVDFANVTRTS